MYNNLSAEQLHQLLNRIQQYENYLPQVSKEIQRQNLEIQMKRQQYQQLKQEADCTNNFSLKFLQDQHKQSIDQKKKEYADLLMEIYKKENAEIINYQPMDCTSLVLCKQPVSKEDYNLLNKKYDIPQYQPKDMTINLIQCYENDIKRLIYFNKWITIFQTMGNIKKHLQEVQPIMEKQIHLIVVQTKCGNIFSLVPTFNQNSHHWKFISLISPSKDDFGTFTDTNLIMPLSSHVIENRNGYEITCGNDNIRFLFDDNHSIVANPHFPLNKLCIISQWEYISVLKLIFN